MEIDNKKDSLIEKIEWMIYQKLTFWQIKSNLALQKLNIDKRSLWKRLKKIK